ncbi:MAG: hypothetical protein UH854_00020 [Clostridia bacterium]|nr:hypothetical protein [Clostridia bacterium]
MALHNYVKQVPELKGISFFTYAEDNNIKLSGTYHNIYLEGPPQHKDKCKFIPQIIAIVK